MGLTYIRCDKYLLRELIVSEIIVEHGEVLALSETVSA